VTPARRELLLLLVLVVVVVVVVVILLVRRKRSDRHQSVIPNQVGGEGPIHAVEMLPSFESKFVDFPFAVTYLFRFLSSHGSPQQLSLLG
jgi:heme/copper-type cytochrome/quinol oxidase subunit 2